MKTRILAVCILMCLAAGMTPAWASGGSRRNQSANEAAPVESEKVLQQVFDQMTTELAAIDQLMKDGENGKALSAAKECLDSARIRSGIQPKSNTREKVEVRGILEESDLKVPFSQLSNRKRDAVATAVYNYRGRLYFDVLNQMKRASLLYLRAFIAQLKSKGDLLYSDIDKVREDLLAVYRVPVLVRQTDLSGDFILFDSDVTNSDQNYLFNRELKVYAIGLKELNMKEYEFERAASDFVRSAQEAHWRGFQTQVEIDQAKRDAQTAKARADYQACAEEVRKSEYNSSSSWHKGAVGEAIGAFFEMFPHPTTRRKSIDEKIQDQCGQWVG